MKSFSIPTLGLLTACAIATTGEAVAETLLDDHFDDGVLGTNTTGIGGGFGIIGNGVSTIGSVSESDSQAKILDGANAGNSPNTTGIISNNTFDLSDSGLSYSVTWDVAKLDFQTAGGLERFFFTLQTNNDWLFAGDAEESRLIIFVDTASASMRYQNRSGGSNANFDSDSSALGSVLNTDPDGFTATLNFDATGYSFTTSGLDTTNQVDLSGTWADMGTDFSTAFATDGGMYVAAYIQDASTVGAALDIDRITVASEVPEPGSLALIGLGGLCVLRRRR